MKEKVYGKEQWEIFLKINLYKSPNTCLVISHRESNRAESQENLKCQWSGERCMRFTSFWKQSIKGLD